MKPTRSMLFVPGHKQAWAKKAVAAGADAVILDLEDSVPEDMKSETRHMVAETIGELAKSNPEVGVYVRLNALETGMMGDDLDAWLAESQLMMRTFRNCAVIAGLIERRFPGQEKTGRQVTISTDLIYNVLREHEPDHILLKAAWADAGTGLLDIHRLGTALARVQGHIEHVDLDRISPLAVPVMLEIGKEPVYGEGHESILEDVSSEDLIAEAMRLD